MSIKSDVEYHYFLMKNGGKEGHLSWAIVVGCRTHKHTWSVMKPSPKLVRNHISTLCRETKIPTGPMILHLVEEKFGCASSPKTVKRICRDIRKDSHPVGKSLAAFMATYRSAKKVDGDGNSYILSIKDHREGDQFDLARERNGLSVIFGDSRLLNKAVIYPRFGCDGTFGIVRGYNEKGEVLGFELVSIVAKDAETGGVYSVMHQLYTRKTTSARSLLFREFVKQLRFRGLRDPLVASGKHRLTMETDFETTYAFSLATVLGDEFGSGSVIDYIKATAVGCDVHAKRCILEKCNVGIERHIFQWALGTRYLYFCEECKNALRFMGGKGGKWNTIATWLESNECAFILWFHKFSCSIPLAERHRALLFDTNVNESYHNRLKSLPKFAMKHGRGLQFMDALAMLREVDGTDARNLNKSSPLHGYQKTSRPEWRRTQSKARKRNITEVIVIDDNPVEAQQPKKAKKASTIRKKRKGKEEQTKIIDTLHLKIERLEKMLTKVLEQNEK